jgi:hypothetical protein
MKPRWRMPCVAADWTSREGGNEIGHVRIGHLKTLEGIDPRTANE